MTETAWFFGDISIDVLYRSHHWPALGDKAVVTPMGTAVGGQIANAARTFNALGGRARFVTLAGTDPSSRHALGTLETEGVDTAHCLIDEGAAIGRVSVFDVGDDTAMLIDEVDPAPIRLRSETYEAMASSGWLVTNLPRLRRLRGPEGESPEEAVSVLRAAGCRILVDADVGDGDADLLALADAVLINDHGFSRLFGDRSGAAEWCAEHGIGLLVRTLGGSGAEAYADAVWHSEAGHEVEVRDTTGGGDAFAAALVLELLRGSGIRTALSRAVAVSAVAVTVVGAAVARDLSEQAQRLQTARRGEVEAT